MYQIATIALRCFSSTVKRSSPPTNVIQHLKERSLIKVSGPDAADFLQGLITNDINHLNKGPGSMFAMFLNIKGRVLYDVLVYRNEDANTYLIECDKEGINSLHKHLKIYKIRKNVQIENYNDYNVFALYNSEVISRQSKAKDCETLSARYSHNCFPQNATEYKNHKDLLIFRDPRVSNLGYRIVTKANVELTLNSLQNIVESALSSKENNYKTLRYSLGVGEGVTDLPTANCTPLENNCDYLHGVSFHKGCYLGQELTARTYHTGVIRKRLLPLFFTKLPKRLPENNIITHENANLGRLRGIENKVGLGLIRINQVLKLGTIQIGDGEAKVVKPDWWPMELPKEKMNVQKS